MVIRVIKQAKKIVSFLSCTTCIHMMGSEFPNTLPQPSVSCTLLSLSGVGESSGLAQGCWHLPIPMAFTQEFESSFQLPMLPRWFPALAAFHP